MEWISINYVIKSQKDRRVEEIMFDHNAENVNEKITNESYRSTYTFRRKEIMLKNKMIVIGCIYQIIALLSKIFEILPKKSTDIKGHIADTSLCVFNGFMFIGLYL